MKRRTDEELLHMMIGAYRQLRRLSDKGGLTMTMEAAHEFYRILETVGAWALEANSDESPERKGLKYAASVGPVLVGEKRTVGEPRPRRPHHHNVAASIGADRMPHNSLTIFQYNAEPHLEEIEALLDPRAKLTLVVRMPWLPDGDIVLTRDDLGEVITAIQRRIDASAKE